MHVEHGVYKTTQITVSNKENKNNIQTNIQQKPIENKRNSTQLEYNSYCEYLMQLSTQ